MQKYLYYFLLLTLVSFIGCATVITPLPGLISGAKFPITYQPSSSDLGEFEIIGQVDGQARANSFLGLIVTGDASINAAYENALSKANGANALIDVKIDYMGTSVFGIIGSYTTIVKAVAVRYNKLPKQATSKNIDVVLNNAEKKETKTDITKQMEKYPIIYERLIENSWKLIKPSNKNIKIFGEKNITGAKMILKNNGELEIDLAKDMLASIKTIKLKGKYQIIDDKLLKIELLDDVPDQFKTIEGFIIEKGKITWKSNDLKFEWKKSGQ